MNTIVRRAGLRELEALTDLFSGYRSFYGQTPDREVEKSFLENRIINDESAIFIAFRAEARTEIQPVGFTQLYPMFSSIRLKPLWILNDLFVVEEARGASVGAKLMEAAEIFARESGAVGLELATEVKNVRAKSLYERRGWVRDSSFDHYNLFF